ncbi:hypothetical protein LR48_Vigan11g160200 [Vigna angularis]|uniref:Uncharacterized protein n=1 Tax=Phaseolus angularis TaxID=3914 RepID=A0A0L9VUG4_PHAAN|nr:hypothetical protein LR48_Vigan11g160200 [Vigna angularis]
MDTGVVASGEVVGGVFLVGDELFRVEELAIGTVSDFVDDSGLKIDKDSARDMLVGSDFAEGVVCNSEGGDTSSSKYASKSPNALLFFKPSIAILLCS